MTPSVSSLNPASNFSASESYLRFAVKGNILGKGRYKAARHGCRCEKENPRVQERSTLQHRCFAHGQSNHPLGSESFSPVRPGARFHSCDVLAGMPPSLPKAIRLTKNENLSSCCLVRPIDCSQQ